MNIEEEIQQCRAVHDPARNTLLKVLSGRGFKIGVEIGVQYGLNAENLLDNNVVEKLYGIDPYCTEIYPISPIRGMDEAICENALQRLKRFKGRFTIIKKTSNEALFEIGGLVDFVYVDGAKGKQHIIDDYSYWYSKIREGGILCGNDYDHPSRPYVNRFLVEHFPDIHSEDNDVWWVEKKTVYTNENISVVIPFYNTGDLAEPLLALPLADPRIAEIIIVDDHSKNEEYDKLVRVVGDNPKIKLFRNEANLGEFKTRIKATEKCTGKWVIFLDGDNTLTTEYIDAIYKIPYWRENVIYCPDYGSHEKIDYRNFAGNYIGLNNVDGYFEKFAYEFGMFLGTGNYFMNRNSYLSVAKPLQEIDKNKYGDYYFNAEWLKRNLMFVVPGMTYIHRIRKNSAWMEHKRDIYRQTEHTFKSLLKYRSNIYWHTEHPMMADREIDYIDGLIERLQPKFCLEWGSGRSTIYFPGRHECIDKWVSVEHGQKWYRYVSARKDPYRTEISLRNESNYLDIGGKYDLILVDGILRNECLIKAKELLNEGGVVLVHDTGRDSYDFSIYSNKEVIFDGEMTNGGMHRGITKLW